MLITEAEEYRGYGTYIYMQIGLKSRFVGKCIVPGELAVIFCIPAAIDSGSGE